MTSVLMSWEIFKSLVMTSVQWSESPDSILSPDWSINGTPGPLIGCYCAQTDLIKSSSDDTFRVSRCKTQDDLLWRKSPNHLMVKPALVVILNLNIYPLSWHKAGNPHYIYNYTMIHSVSGAHQTQSSDPSLDLGLIEFQPLYHLSRDQTIGTNCLRSFSEIEPGLLTSNSDSINMSSQWSYVLFQLSLFSYFSFSGVLKDKTRTVEIYFVWAGQIWKFVSIWTGNDQTSKLKADKSGK